MLLPRDLDKDTHAHQTSNRMAKIIKQTPKRAKGKRKWCDREKDNASVQLIYFAGYTQAER